MYVLCKIAPYENSRVFPAVFSVVLFLVGCVSYLHISASLMGEWFCR